MAYDEQAVIEGPIRGYIGASADDAVPDVMPDDDVAFGDPGGTYVPIGFTTPDGFGFGGLSPNRSPVFSAQQRDAVKRLAGNSEETVTFTLIETDVANIGRVSGRGTVTEVAAGASTYGHTKLVWNDTPAAPVSFLAEGFGPDGSPRRYFYPKCEVMINGEMRHQIGQESRVPVTITRVGGDEAQPVWQDVHPPTA